VCIILHAFFFFFLFESLISKFLIFSHGTRCAGASSGKANNGMCGVGVAYNSYIAAIRLLDGRITTLLEARALTLFAVNVSIKSASWG
jgi:hypothetical protein